MSHIPFLQKLIKEEVSFEDINKFIEEWHEEKPPMVLSQFLGMTDYEYALWVEHPLILPLIVSVRKLGASVTRAPTPGSTSGNSNDFFSSLVNKRVWLQTVTGDKHEGTLLWHDAVSICLYKQFSNVLGTVEVLSPVLLMKSSVVAFSIDPNSEKKR